MGKQGNGLGRRTYLATIGAAGVAMTAGCGSATDIEKGEPSSKDVPPPSVNPADKWTLRTPESEPRLLRKGSISFLDYQAVGHIQEYEDSQLRNRIAEDTFGEVDRPFAVAFCGRIDIFPSAASIASGLVSDIDETMVENLETSMTNFGVENLQETNTTTISGVSSDFRTVVGDYQIEPVTIEGIDVPHSDRSQLQFGGGSLPIRGIIGNWKADGSILVGGGVYPDGHFSQSEEIRMSDAISLSVNIDLQLRPHQREQDIFEFVRSISL